MSVTTGVEEEQIPIRFKIARVRGVPGVGNIPFKGESLGVLGGTIFSR